MFSSCRSSRDRRAQWNRVEGNATGESKGGGGGETVAESKRERKHRGHWTNTGGRQQQQEDGFPEIRGAWITQGREERTTETVRGVPERHTSIFKGRRKARPVVS